MWKGRFAKATADLVQQYGESISYDWRMYHHDIAGSIAHARAQVKAGILTEDEFSTIEQGLREIEKEIASGGFDFSIELEDIHMNIESALTKRSAPLALNSTPLDLATTKSLPTLAFIAVKKSTIS